MWRETQIASRFRWCVCILALLKNKKSRKLCLEAATIAGSSWIHLVSCQMSSPWGLNWLSSEVKEHTWGQHAEQVDRIKSPSGENDKLWQHLKKHLHTFYSPFLLVLGLVCALVKKENRREGIKTEMKGRHWAWQPAYTALHFLLLLIQSAQLSSPKQPLRKKTT